MARNAALVRQCATLVFTLAAASMLMMSMAESSNVSGRRSSGTAVRLTSIAQQAGLRLRGGQGGPPMAPDAAAVGDTPAPAKGPGRPKSAEGAGKPKSAATGEDPAAIPTSTVRSVCLVFVLTHAR